MEIRVLGPLEVRLQGSTAALGARMERALLTILVLEGGRVVPADRLTDLLWDGDPPPKAAAALHTKIARLRRALQPDRTPRTDSSVVVTAAPGYRLAREHMELDADRFEALVAEATRLLGGDDPAVVRLVDEALGLWRGPAFGEFADEPFARAAAERLETLRLAAVELRATANLRLGDTAGAVAALQPHVAVTARPPEPTIRPLRGREQECGLLAHAVTEASAGSGSVVLVTGDAGMGKSALLEVLRDAVVAAGGLDRSATCHDGLAGPPFWPVLQMVRRAVPRLDVAGRTRLARALGPLRDAVPGLPGPPEGTSAAGGVDPATVLMHASDALDVVLGSAPEGGVGPPALVAFDDLHAADPATLRLVAGLAAGVHRTRTVLAVALRSGESNAHPALVDTLGALGRLPRVLRVDVGPLPAPAITELIRAEAGADVDPAALERIAGRAEGNPFFALELARVATRPDTPPAGGAGRPVGGVPAAVYDVLRQRYLRLPEGGTDLLAAAAVAGSPVSVDDVAAVTGLPADRVLALVDAAVEARLVVDVGDGRVAPAHALLGEAVLAGQSSARRVRLHRAFADRLAERHGSGPDEASRIAAHYLAARVVDDGAAALIWLERAADHAVALSALDQLKELGEQVLALLAAPSDDPDRRRRELRAHGRIAFVDAWYGGMDSPTIRGYCRLVRAWEVPRPAQAEDMELLWLATLFSGQVGRLDDADVLVARMAALDDELDDPTARYLRFDMGGVVRWMQGRFADALAELDLAEAAAAAGVDLRRSLAFSPATRIAIVRAHCLWHLGDRAAAWEQVGAALAAADASGFGASGFARRWALVLAMMDGDARRVRQLLERPLSEPAWERFHYPSAVVRFARGWADARGGKASAGLAEMREAHATLAGQGLIGGRPVLLGLMAEEELRQGHASEALSLCEAGLAIGERGERYWAAALQRVAAEAAEAADVSGSQEGGERARRS